MTAEPNNTTPGYPHSINPFPEHAPEPNRGVGSVADNCPRCAWRMGWISGWHDARYDAQAPAPATEWMEEQRRKHEHEHHSH